MNYHNNKKVIRRRTYIYSLAFILAIFLVSLVYGYLLGWVLSWVVHIQHLNLILSFLFFVYLTTHAITKYNSLATVGGKAIAEKLDAVLIEGSNLDINSIKVKNIVEELSIASGIKPPSIYVLKRELGMNAFVAGFTEDDAVFIISQEAIEKFNRDELSAVISNEYCHLQNGDMAFNMLMLCWAKGLDLPYRKASKIFRNRIDFIIRNKSKSGWLILFTGLIMFLGILGHALCGAIIAAINSISHRISGNRSIFTTAIYADDSDIKINAIKWFINLKSSKSIRSCKHSMNECRIIHVDIIIARILLIIVFFISLYIGAPHSVNQQ